MDGKCKDCAFCFERGRFNYDKYGSYDESFICDLTDDIKSGGENGCEKFTKKGEKIKW